MTSKASGWTLGYSLGSFYFCYFAVLGAVVPYMSLYLESIDFDSKQIGMLMSTLLITKLIAPNFWGYVIDRRSVNNPEFGIQALIISLVICCLFFGSLNLTKQFWMIAICMFGYSFFWNAVLPQTEAIVYNYLGENRFRYGLIRLWGSIGFILIVLLLGWLIDQHGIHILISIVTGIFVLLALNSLLLKKVTVQQTPQIETGNIWQLFTPQIIIVLSLGAIGQMTHAPFYTFFSIYLESYGYSKTMIGWLWALGVIMEVGVFLYAHLLLARFNIFNLLMLCFVMTAVRWWIIASFPESLSLLSIGQALHAISFGFYHATASQIINAQFRGKFQVRGQALYSSITFGLGGAIGTLASGYLWAALPGTTVFMLCAIVMIVATLVGIIINAIFK